MSSPSDSPIQIETVSRQGKCVVNVSGDIDAATSPELADALRAVAEAGELKVLVDLSGVEFIDSSGLRVLLGAYRAIAVTLGGSFELIVRDRVKKLIEIAGLSELLGVPRSS